MPGLRDLAHRASSHETAFAAATPSPTHRRREIDITERALLLQALRARTALMRGVLQQTFGHSDLSPPSRGPEKHSDWEGIKHAES